METQMDLNNLTYEELAKLSRLTVPFLKKAIKRYSLPHYKLGRLVRFKWSDYEKWKEQQKVG